MRGGVLVILMAAVVVGCDNTAPAPPTAPAVKAELRQVANASRGGRPAAVRATTSHAPVEKPAPGEAPDLSYLPGDAFAAVIFNARRALQSQALAALPYDELLAGSLEARHGSPRRPEGTTWNFDPRDVEHWLLFLTPAVEDEPLGTPYSPGAVMRFVKPVDGRRLIATRGEVREARIGDKTCYVQTAQQPIAFYVADDRTIVFAAEKQLMRMLDGAKVICPLARRLAALDRECDLHLVVNVEPLTSALDDMAQAASQQISPVAVPYINALRDVSMLTLTADLSGEQFLAASVEARDREAAARLHQLAKESGPLVQTVYAVFRGAVVRAWRGDASQAVLDITDSVMARAAVEYGETSLNVQVGKPLQLNELGRRLRLALERQPYGSQQPESRNR